MTRTWLPCVVALAAAVACHSHDSDAPAPSTTIPIDAGARTPVVSPACRAAIHAGSATALDARVAVLLDACQVCGPWAPILDWRRTPQTGGPTRAQIEDAMIGCSAYCDPNGKERFLGTLDEARGSRSRQPWRQLAEMCRAAVSAVPDTRYASATLFALDRVARAVGSAGGSDADLLAKLDIPLPAVSVSGIGVELPKSTAVEATAPRTQVTVTGNEVRTGKLPIGHLTAAGMVTDYGGGEAYPGALMGSAGGSGSGSAAGNGDEIVVLAPSKLGAERVANVVAQLHAPRVLLAAAIDGPDSWQLVGTIAVSLVDPASTTGAQTIALAGPVADVIADPAKPVRVEVSAPATVADLAELLTKLHALGVKQIALHSR